MGSLRDELTGTAVERVDYRLLCPTGWSKVPPSALVEGPAVVEVLEAMKTAGRADLVLQFRAMLSQLRIGMAEQGVFEVYVAPETDDGVPLPGMITVSPFVLPEGISWDAALARLARGSDVETIEAQSLLHRFRTDDDYADDTTRLRSTRVSYVAPVPGGDGRRALLFQLIVLAVEDARTREVAEALLQVGAVIMSTLRWVPAE